MVLSRVSWLSKSVNLSYLLPFSQILVTPSHPPIRTLRASASLSAQESTRPVLSATMNRWKPMCLYYTQGKCTKCPRVGNGYVEKSHMDDPTHLESFNHNFSGELKLNVAEFKNMLSQQLDFFLVLDLEGKVEILEFPVLMVDAKTMDVVDFFHRFVRPSQMGQQRIDEYIEGKYGKIGVDRRYNISIVSVWHDTAIPFKEVTQQFEDWLAQHHLWRKDFGGGNWDLKTKVPQQCEVSRMKLPSYFMEWINLKDVYLNFYKRRATGMITMMKELQIPLVGSHHLGIDDTKNITRVLQRMLADGAVLQITARRNANDLRSVEFLFNNRIR
ncbi:hypothetical protein RJ639_039601 [Escallonia herrerae]|uniref:Exonuclease domain-containing protein n=1 Tax=Escallonia herrerae TaxID=1293975 RepID=A0AA88WIC4_9ASTE|nr:hypothetical protein RJ639_039601 [Escallonia herrerae]